MCEDREDAQLPKNQFDIEINRIGTRSQKWDSREAYQNGSLIPMWVADMDFPVDQRIMEAIRKRTEHPVFGYVYAGESMAKAASRWMLKRHGWTVDPAHVAFCPGIVPAISAAVQTFSSPGGAVVIQSPVYYPFAGTIRDCGREVVTNPLLEKNGEYSVDFADLERKIRDSKARLMILCNPHNPVGRVYSAEELMRIAEICLRNEVFLFSDEIHADLILRGYRHTPIASLSKAISQNCLTGISPSKTFNLAGLQTAAVICENEERLKAFNECLHRNAINFPNSFGTEAFIAAYENGEEYLESLLSYLQENYEYAKQFFSKELPILKLTPLEGTYLLWIDCRGLHMTDRQLDEFMERRAGLALDSGYWFGKEANGFMRMNIACPRKTLEKALNRLCSAVKLFLKERENE